MYLVPYMGVHCLSNFFSLFFHVLMHLTVKCQYGTMLKRNWKQRSTTGPVTVLVGMRSIHFKNGLKCQESRGDQEEGDGAELFLNSCFLDTVFVTLFCTAVKTAISTAVETAVTTLVALHWPPSPQHCFSVGGWRSLWCLWVRVMGWAMQVPPPPSPFPIPNKLYNFCGCKAP